MAHRSVGFAVDGGVARITFDRPDAANAIDLQVAGELMEAANRIADDRGIRCVVLAGSGPFFCAGGDVNAFAAQGENLPAYLNDVVTLLHVAVSRLVRQPAPVVAAVRGAAAGAGFSLACASDLVLASQSARFVLAYTAIGLSPDGASTYFLPRLVGLRRALELTLTNRTLSAQEALEWGLVTRVIPDQAFDDEVEALVGRLAVGPTAAFGRTRELLRRSSTGSLETQMEHELRELIASSRTADGREGIAAFLDKRAPRFTGETHERRPDNRHKEG